MASSLDSGCTHADAVSAQTQPTSLDAWLDDLCVRFLLNQPQEELGSVERICFQIEKARWFYEDHIRCKEPDLPLLPAKDFRHAIFRRCPLLSGFSAQLANLAYSEFQEYKMCVPVRGAILLNKAMDQVVLVRDLNSKRWSFPRGKINKGETDLTCALREVHEETGSQAKGVKKDAEYLEVTMKGQSIRLYIIPDVPLNTPFKTQTIGEVGKISWFKISNLPDHPSVSASREYFRVAPFVKALKEWIIVRKGGVDSYGMRGKLVFFGKHIPWKKRM